VLGPNKKFIVEPFAAVYVCGKGSYGGITNVLEIK